MLTCTQVVSVTFKGETTQASLSDITIGLCARDMW